MKIVKILFSNDVLHHYFIFVDKTVAGRANRAASGCRVGQ